MLTLISSIAGFLTSGVPKVLEFVQDKSDKKQELEMMRMQMERELTMQNAGFQAKREVAEIEYDRSLVEAEVREVESLHKFSSQLGDGASQWVVNLRASVQPCITYGLFFLLVFIDGYACWYAVETGMEFTGAIETIWTDDTQALWAAIVAFWFGGRQFNTKRK
jgi:hypothetical protein